MRELNLCCGESLRGLWPVLHPPQSPSTAHAVASAAQAAIADRIEAESARPIPYTLSVGSDADSLPRLSDVGDSCCSTPPLYGSSPIDSDRSLTSPLPDPETAVATGRALETVMAHAVWKQPPVASLVEVLARAHQMQQRILRFWKRGQLSSEERNLLLELDKKAKELLDPDGYRLGRLRKGSVTPLTSHGLIQQLKLLKEFFSSSSPSTSSVEQQRLLFLALDMFCVFGELMGDWLSSSPDGDARHFAACRFLDITPEEGRKLKDVFSRELRHEDFADRQLRTRQHRALSKEFQEWLALQVLDESGLKPHQEKMVAQELGLQRVFPSSRAYSRVFSHGLTAARADADSMAACAVIQDGAIDRNETIKNLCRWMNLSPQEEDTLADDPEHIIFDILHNMEVHLGMSGKLAPVPGMHPRAAYHLSDRATRLSQGAPSHRVRGDRFGLATATDDSVSPLSGLLSRAREGVTPVPHLPGVDVWEATGEFSASCAAVGMPTAGCHSGTTTELLFGLLCATPKTSAGSDSRLWVKEVAPLIFTFMNLGAFHTAAEVAPICEAFAAGERFSARHLPHLAYSSSGSSPEVAREANKHFYRSLHRMLSEVYQPGFKKGRHSSPPDLLLECTAPCEELDRARTPLLDSSRS